MKKIITLLFLMAFVCVKGWGQTNVFEGFESGNMPPTTTSGWTVSGSYPGYLFASNANSATSPTPAPYAGSYDCEWDSYSAPSGAVENLISPKIDWSGRGSNTPTVTLYFYRDGKSSSYIDNMTLLVNTSTSTTGATTLGTIYRSRSLATTGAYITGTSTTTTTGWYAYTFTIPASYASATNYLIFQFASNDGYDCFLDNITYQTYPNTNPALSANPTTLAFGSSCLNTSPAAQSTTITGSNLTIANVAIGPLTGYTFSTTAAGTYSASLSLTHAAGSYSQPIYVKFTPTAAITYNGNIPVSGGGATTINVAVTGTGVNSPPTVTASAATGLTLTGATIAGNITAAGCTAVTDNGIVYSTTSGFNPATTGTKVPSTTPTSSSFSVTLNTLTQNTTYYYYTYATNSGGTSYSSPIQQFKTLASTLTVTPTSLSFGSVCTNTTSSVSSFTINGSNLTTADVTLGAVTGYAYSTTSGGTYTSTLTIPQMGGSFSQQIFVQFTPTAVATYNGTISVGGGGATTPASETVTGSGVNTAPTVTASAATGLTLTGATIAGNITAAGCTAVTDYGIVYSTTSGFNPATTGTPVSATNLSTGSFSVTLNTLTQNTTYYYYTYATNSGGTSYSSPIQQFKTLASTLTVTPTSLSFGSVCTNTTSSVSSFTINGSNLTTADVTLGAITGYAYSTTSGGTYTSTLTIPQGGGSFSQQIFVQFTPTAVATYNGTISVGGGGATTPASETVTGTGINTAPTVTSGAASSVTYNSAIVAGTLTTGCSTISAYGIEYSTTNNFANGTGTPVPATNLSGGAFSSNLSGLTAVTTYYFHAYATTSGGTTIYGAQGTFATPPVNDDCTGAITMTSSPTCTSVNGTTVNATQQLAPTSCSSALSSSAKEVWYKFTADGSSSYTITATTGTISDLVLGLYSGSCSSLTLITCSDVYSSGTETINAGMLAAGTYYYRVYGYNGVSGTFTTCVTAPLTYRDLWVSTSTGSSAWCAGETRNVTVTVKNNGTATWVSGGSGVNFSYYWTAGQTHDANPRILPFTGAGLAPGQQQAITFAVTAPSTANTYNLNFDLVREGACWFSDNVAGCSGPGNLVYSVTSQTINALPQGSLTGNAICAGGTGQLTFTATSGTGPFTVVYNDGTANQTALNVTSGTAFNVVTNPATTTNYTLVSVTNSAAGNSCVTSSGFTGGTATITVKTPPSIGIGGQPANQATCAGVAKIFTVSNVSGTSPTYQWQYSIDGSTNWANVANGTPANITYTNTTSASLTVTPAASAASGTYYYQCIVSVSGCATPATSTAASLAVTAAPTITTQPQAQTVCLGNSFNLSVGANNATGYQWQLNGNNILNATGSSYTVASAASTDGGNYAVIVSGNSPCGSTTSATVLVTITAPPSITSSPASQTICAGATTTFAVGASGSSLTYQWQYSSDGGNTYTPITTGMAGNFTFANFTTATITVTPSAGAPTATYLLRCVVGSTGCTATAPSLSASVIVNALPTIVSVTGGGSFCGGTATLTASNGNSGTIYFEGTNSNGTSIATPSTSQTVTTSGTYYFRALSTAGCWGTQGSQVVTINAVPAAVTVSGTTPACGSTTITASGGSGGTIYFEGTTSNGTSTATQSASQTVTTSGTYYFRSYSAAGCWGPQGSITVTINALPAAVTVSGGGTVCGSATLTASNNGDGTIYFEGTNASGTATNLGGSPQTITTSGTYYFRAQSSAGCWGTPGSAVVTITPVPVFTSVTATPATICSGGSSQLVAAVSSSASYTYTSIASPSPATGNPVVLLSSNSSYTSGDDNDGYRTINLPFPFYFYGVARTSASISVNGYITFGSGSTANSGTAIPNNDFGSSNPVIALCYSNLGAIGGTVDTFTVGTAPNRKFVIQYVAVNFLQSGSSYTGSVTGQIELDESSNIVDIYLNSVINGGSNRIKSVGVQASNTNGVGATNRNGTNWTVNALEGHRFSNFTYSWSPATGLSSSTIYNPVASPTNATSSPVTIPYTVTATAAGTGCSASSSINLTVNPVTAITGQPASTQQTLCEGTPISFSVTASGANLTYQWHTASTATPNPNTDPLVPDANGGKTNTINTVVVSGSTYYYVVITGTCGSITSNLYPVASIAVNITSQPTATQTVCQTVTGAASSASQFSPNVSGSNVSFQWYVNTTNSTNGGTLATGTGNDKRVYTPPTNVAGTFYYYLVASSDLCNNTSDTTNIAQVIVNPPTAITSNVSTTTQEVCQNVPVNTLSVTAVGGSLSYQWYSNTTNSNTGGTAITGATGTSYTPSTAGTNGVTVTTYYYVKVSGNCAPTPIYSSVATVIVHPTPAPTLTLNPSSGTYCAKHTSISYTTESGQSNYAWTVPGTQNVDYTITAGGTSSTDNTVTLIWLTSSSKTVTVNYTSPFGCTTPTAATSTITVTPNATIAYMSGNASTQTPCVNTPITAITYTTGGTATGASVTGLPSGVTGTYNTNNSVFTISGTPTVSGTFTYTVSGTGGPCTSESLTGTITVQPNATIALSSAAGTDAQTPCISTAITSIVYQTGGSATGASITSGSLPSGVTGSYSGGIFTISGTPNVTGTFNYTITASGGSCVNQTASGTITVNANATIALTSAAGTTSQTPCINTAITNITYTIGGGGMGAGVTGLPTGVTGSYSGGVFTISGTPTQTGSFTYTVTTTGTCAQASAGGTITVQPNATITLTSGTTTNAQSICSGNAITNITYSIGGGGTNAGVTGLPTGVTGSYSGGVFTISGTPTQTPTQTGTFNYTVTTTGTCVQTAATGSITINQTPTANFAQTSYSSCAPIAVSPVINGTPSATVSYTINGGSTQTAQITTGGNVVLPPSSTTANTYTYLITGVSLGTCPGTTGGSNQTSIVTIHALPDATISFNPGTGYVQLGNTITLTDATSGGTWSNTTPAVASLNTGTSTTVTGLTSGTTTVGYTTPTDGNGCFNTSTQVVTVTADFVTKNNGNFSDYHTWNLGTPNGLQPSTSPIPTATTTVEVQHALNLDQNFQVGTGKSFNITGSGTMTILPSITFSSLGTVDFGSKLVTVQSTSAGTGAIGQMATPILNATNVTAERFIGSATFATGKRAWRLLTAPVSGQTINNAWQEGLVSATNTPAQGDLTYGTLITGTRQSTAANAAANGFDFWPEIGNANTSIVYYSNGRWNTFTSIKGLNIESQPAYLLFVRGNRSKLKGDTGITTLRANGTLNQVQKSFTVSGSTTYTLVGNPFAAPIDFEKVYTANQLAPNQNIIQPRFLVWNSQNGVYGSYTLVTRTGTNSYSTVPNVFNTGGTGTGTSNQFIVSGQGFFVQPANGGGTLVISDSAKTSSATSGINPYRLSPATDQRLYVNLNLVDDTTTTLADGVLARFDATYSSAIDEDDVPKQSNFNENIAIETSGSSWIVEARPEVVKTDTVQLRVWNETKRSYQLQIKGENFAAAQNASGLHAYLQDSYLGTSREVSLTGSITTVAFTVNSDSASQSASRFRIVFQQGTVSALPVTLTSVSAAPQTGGVAVGWTVTNETNLKDYVIERSTDGGSTFTAIATQEAKNNPGAALTTYSSLDGQPHRGDNLYRIRIEGRDGTVSYSKVVKAVWGEESSNQITIAMYPNPVGREGKVSLQLSNLREGTYLVRVYSEGGQTVYQRKISISQGSSTQSEELRIGNRLAGGSYQLRLTDSKGKVVYAHALIIAK